MHVLHCSEWMHKHKQTKRNNRQHLRLCTCLWILRVPIQFRLQLAVGCIGYDVLLSTALCGHRTHVQHKVCTLHPLSIWGAGRPTGLARLAAHLALLFTQNKCMWDAGMSLLRCGFRQVLRAGRGGDKMVPLQCIWTFSFKRLFKTSSGNKEIQGVVGSKYAKKHFQVLHHLQ